MNYKSRIMKCHFHASFLPRRPLQKPPFRGLGGLFFRGLGGLIFMLAFCLSEAQAQTTYQNFTLGENQYLLGYSTSDTGYTSGSSANKGDVTIATYIKGSLYKRLKNCKAVGIRFCLPSNVQVKKVTLHKSTKAAAYNQVPTKTASGWNYVPFDTPQKLDATGVYISYTYVQDMMSLGICHWPEIVDGGYWTCFEGQWFDWSQYYGAVCMQLVVEADPLPDYGLEFSSVVNNPVIQDEEGQMKVNLVSNSKKSISSFDYSLTVGDAVSTGTVTLDHPLDAGLDKQTSAFIPVPAQPAYGNYASVLDITGVNGEALEAVTATKSFSLPVYTRRAGHRSVMEEYTGTACGNCPRGWFAMEYLNETYPDRFIGIALHQYNSSDPMYCNRYASLGFSAAPMCKIDRKITTDPYYGTTSLGIDLDIEEQSQIAPPVDVSVSGMISDTHTKVTCTADLEFLCDTGKYTIAYVLTADSLAGEGSLWQQTNSYQIAKASPTHVLPQMAGFADFFSGERYGQETVSLVFNDVMIGSSYSTTGTNAAKSMGTSHKAGDKVNNTYTCTISASAKAKAALRYDKIYVIALVMDTKGNIVNAAKALVTPIPEGISAQPVTQSPQSTALYDLSGRPVISSSASSSRSLIIERRADGTVRKVLAR